MQPLVTVIVPNYNHERFLKRRIESILNQTFQNFELIILDDKSTDNSREIIEQYRSHPKVKTIVYNDTNSGSPFKQWAKGMALAQSEWIWIAESDDHCAPGFLASLRPAFGNKACVLAYAEVVFCNEEGTPIKPAIDTEPVFYEGTAFLRKKMVLNDYLCNSGMVVFRKNAVSEVDASYKTFRLAGDYFFWSEIARQGMIYASGKPLAFFTKHPKELSAGLLDSDVHYQEDIKVLEQMLSRKSIGRADIRKRVHAELIRLICAKGGMPFEVFNKLYRFWQHFAQENNAGISPAWCHLQAFKRKGLHFTRKLANG